MSTRPRTQLSIRDGRCLITHKDGEGEQAGWPEVAYEAIRNINHLTHDVPVPAPTLYDVLGNLTLVGQSMPQKLTQRSHGLARSLDEFDVYDRSGDPARSVTNAQASLAEAAEHAHHLA